MPDQPDDSVFSLSVLIANEGTRCALTLVIVVWTIAATIRALRQPHARGRMRSQLGDLALVGLACVVLQLTLEVGNAMSALLSRPNAPTEQLVDALVLGVADQISRSFLPVAASVFALVCRLFLGLKFGPPSEPPARGDA